MGKLTRSRKKFHLSRHNSVSGDTDVSNAVTTTDPGLPLVTPVAENIFSGVHIKLDNITRTFSADDCQSVASTSKREFKNGNLSKKQRRNLRHETFINRINEIKRMKKEWKQQDKKTTERRPQDVLPLLESFSKIDKKKVPPKPRSVPKAKKRRKNLLQDVSAFQKLMQNPDYKNDPVSAITNYIQQQID